MGLFDRFRRKQRPGVLRSATSTDTGHLEQWAAARRGVEAYVEPKTVMHPLSVVLVAGDGEHKRFELSDDAYVRELGREHDLKVFDAARLGYPQRMRDYAKRQRQAGSVLPDRDA